MNKTKITFISLAIAMILVLGYFLRQKFDAPISKQLCVDYAKQLVFQYDSFDSGVKDFNKYGKTLTQLRKLEIPTGAHLQCVPHLI